MAETSHSKLLKLNWNGLYCEAGDFYIDPWRGADRAVITHAHGDHARTGSKSYLTVREGEEILRARIGQTAKIETEQYGVAREINGVKVSFHPAGHLLGSSQIRVEHRGEVWVVSGDYKTDPCLTCAPFEVVPCNTFITESTFALPIFEWKPQNEVFNEINRWWQKNQADNRTSVIYAYALGKAQRVLSGLDPSIGPIVVHSTVAKFLPAYARHGINLPPVVKPEFIKDPALRGRAMIIAPMSVAKTSWLKRFGSYSTAFASGWMQLRSHRLRRGVDQGFVLSDHADWNGLLQTVANTGAESIGVTHGYTQVLVRHLREQGYRAFTVGGADSEVEV